MQDIGDRMKEFYENRHRFYLTRRSPVIIRVDARSFSNYTKSFDKPFDQSIINSMMYAATKVAKDMQGFKLAYVQSDEASFLITDYDDIHTDAWFGYNKSKMESIAASMMSVFFNAEIQDELQNTVKTKLKAFFDARSFNIPIEEIANYFLWRAKDWERNSLQMYCGAYFSHNDLFKKNKQDKHEMLYSIGKNWTTDLTDIQKNGTFIINTDNGLQFRHDVQPTYSAISEMMGDIKWKKDLVVR